MTEPQTDNPAPSVPMGGPRYATPAPLPTHDTVFDASEAIDKLATALALAQSNYATLKATQTADAERYTYNYADLAAVFASVRPALSEQSIAIVQGVSMQRGSTSGLVVIVETRLLHGSGQWLATTLRLPTSETLPQKVGSLVSYLRRYGLQALAGVAAEDDDGASVSKPAPAPRTAPRRSPQTQAVVDAAEAIAARELPATELPPARKPRATKPKAQDEKHAPLAGGNTISAADRGLLFKVAREQQWTERQVKGLIFSLFGYNSTSQITQGDQFNKVINAMENPGDHGVSFDNDGADVIYIREDDRNPVPVDVTEGL